MNMKKIISIVLGILIIVVAIIMPFHLSQICYEFDMHQQEWTLSGWAAVQIQATIYGIIICVLTLILVLMNVLKKSK